MRIFTEVPGVGWSKTVIFSVIDLSWWNFRWNRVEVWKSGNMSEKEQDGTND